MANGKTVLRKIDDSIRKLEADADRRSFDIAKARAEAASLRIKVAQDLSAIARIQAEALTEEEFAAYDALTRSVDNDLSRRAAEESRARAGLDACMTELTRLLAAEDQALADVEAAQEQVRRLRDSVAIELKSVPAHEALLQRLEEAAGTAAAAAERALAARAERDEKARAYYDDPLFSYLLGCRFGEPAYAAGPVTRTLDEWVAGLCNFRQAAKDLRALEQLPVFLDAHASEMEAAHIAADTAVQESSRERLRARGVDALEQALALAKQALKEARARVEEAEQRAHAGRDAVNEFESWTDGTSTRICERLVASFGNEALSLMRARVLKTKRLDDDDALARVGAATERIRGIEAAIQGLEQAARAALTRVERMQSLRKRFVATKYNSSSYTFPTATIDAALSGYVLGKLLDEAVWSTVKSAASYDPPSSTVSTGSYSSSSSYSSRSSGFGGGGFRSGGGFGGGGFSTGGGF